jgi:dihydroorotate dehydrogenase (NAD+) catalytic subunit
MARRFYSMISLKTNLGRLKLENPVMCASGCFGYGYELADYTDLHSLGAISLKTITPEPRNGNPPPRIKEVSSGILTSIGLQNPGADFFMKSIMPRVKEACKPNQIIVSIAGNTVEEYVNLTAVISERYGKGDIAAIEINTACPNVKLGGGAFCSNPAIMGELLSAVLKTTALPVIAKINTNYDNTVEIAKVIEESGVDAISTTSTPVGMSIDIKKRKPVLGNKKGPISGRAVRPIGVGKVWDIYRAVKIPITAGGGIYTAEDALEYIMAGATAVGVGSAHFINPRASMEILEGLKAFLADNGISDISSLIGAAHE